MSSQWFWKPVVVGIILFTLIGCFFSAFIIVLFNCPGLGSACLAHFPTILNDFISLGRAPILIGGAAGAILGALYAWIHRWIQKTREGAKRAEWPPNGAVERSCSIGSRIPGAGNGEVLLDVCCRKTLGEIVLKFEIRFNLIVYKLFYAI